MRSITSELDKYKKFIERKTGSRNASCVYVEQVQEFLEQHPEAAGLGEDATRKLVDGYIEDAVPGHTKENLATAVRSYWSYRFGKPYSQRHRQHDFPPNDSIDEELVAYRAFLLKSKPFTQVTVASRIGSARRFLYTMFKSSCFARGSVTVEVVRDYLAYSTPQLAPATKARAASDIRSYAGFLAAMGHPDTAATILRLPLSPSHRKGSKLPGRIEDSDLRAMISSIDPSSERGARDLALVLLMGTLGLRVGDTVRLCLEDVDWAEGEVVVRSSKSKTQRRLPLEASCGDALERYVREFRPKAETRRIFLVTGHERGDGPLSNAQAGRAVGSRAKKAGLHSFSGTRSIRRAVATDMVSQGVDIKTVADILGHEAIVTAMGYLRLDVESLRNVAADWPVREVPNGCHR